MRKSQMDSLRIMGVCIAALAILFSILFVTTHANAAGSDGSTPYSVTTDGITLPSGSTFQDNGHVNLRTTVGNFNMHFEGKCITRTDAECSGARHDAAQFIGKSFIPWSAFGLTGQFCVSWVQISQFNEHFGEGGQTPVCVGTPPVEPPVEEPPVVVEPPVILNPLVTLVTGECYWNESQGLSFKSVSFILSNQSSNIDHEFVFGYYPEFNTVVPAGQTVTVRVQDMYGLGGSYNIDGVEYKIDSFDCKPIVEPPVVVDPPIDPPVEPPVIVDPPVEPPVISDPPVVITPPEVIESNDDELARTGAEDSVYWLIGLFAAGFLILGILIKLRRKKI